MYEMSKNSNTHEKARTIFYIPQIVSVNKAPQGVIFLSKIYD